MDFEWDEDNLRHVLEESPHGVTPSLVERIGDGRVLFFPNAPREGRTGSHAMVGLDEDGRFWTIIVLERSEELWRPITGWPSTGREIRLYREAQ